MFKIFLILLVLAVVLAAGGGVAFARSGCCSGHGGVCGCGCCDGAGLSAVCAPYYEGCENSGFAAALGGSTAAGGGLSSGWQLVALYAIAVSFVLFFGLP